MLNSKWARQAHAINVERERREYEEWQLRKALRAELHASNVKEKKVTKEMQGTAFSISSHDKHKAMIDMDQFENHPIEAFMEFCKEKGWRLTDMFRCAFGSMLPCDWDSVLSLGN